MKSNRNERHRLYMQLLQSREWRELRAAKIRDCQGLCERCKELGIITAAKTVHHRTPVETGETLEAMRELCYRYDNLQLLCADCHHRAHEEDTGRRHESVQLNRYPATWKRQRSIHNTTLPG